MDRISSLSISSNQPVTVSNDNTDENGVDGDHEWVAAHQRTLLYKAACSEPSSAQILNHEIEEEEAKAYIAQPVGSDTEQASPETARTERKPSRRIKLGDGSASYSYDLPYIGLQSLPSSDQDEGGIERSEIGAHGSAAAPFTATLTPSVIEPSSWVSFDYPKGTAADLNVASEEIDYCAPRLAIFEVSSPGDDVMDRSLLTNFRPPRSQYSSYSLHNEDHPYFSASAAEPVVTGAATHTSRLSITNPDPETAGMSAVQLDQTPDELPQPTCWQAFTQFLSRGFSCASSLD